MAESIFTLLMLILLQAVLGFDNLLYISLESKRAPLEKQAFVRNWGIGIAMALRIILLFVLMAMVQRFQTVVFEPDWGWLSGAFNIHSFIVIGGGVFILYTATKEILHMMAPEVDALEGNKKQASVGSVITMIVIMNVVFSFDSILSAMALTSDANGQHDKTAMVLMAIAILIGGLLMIFLAGKVTRFLQKNRMYEVLGLFILFVVGIMLLTEGAHLGDMALFGNHITAMSKTTFYFVIAVLVLVDVVQGRYLKKLQKKKSNTEFAAENKAVENV